MREKANTIIIYDSLKTRKTWNIFVTFQRKCFNDFSTFIRSAYNHQSKIYLNGEFWKPGDLNLKFKIPMYNSAQNSLRHMAYNSECKDELSAAPTYLPNLPASV